MNCNKLFNGTQRLVRVAFTLSTADLQARFATARLGFYWLFIQQLIWAFGAGFVWSKVFGLAMSEFLPFIMVSFAAWNLIASFFVDSSASFQNSGGYLKNTLINPVVYVIRPLLTNLVILLIALIPFVFYSIFIGEGGGNPRLILSGLSIIYLCICLLPISISIAYLGVLFRDLTPALQSLFQVLFVISPVIYPPEVVKRRGYEYVLDYNPFYYLIELIRRPLLEGRFAESGAWLVLAAFGFLGYLFLWLYLWRRIRRVAIYV
jgi:ABC-type polysaccharide/polyol phosphate export permease